VELLPLTPDELLTTTRTVRRRLDLDRTVDRSLVEECVEVALQAPNGGNRQRWTWLLVDDPARKQALADIYRAAFSDYGERMRQVARDRPAQPAAPQPAEPRYELGPRMAESVMFLAEHLHEVPVLGVPVQRGRPPDDLFAQATYWASIVPAVWSFMLALRARGLGSAWTTATLMREQAVADVLGFPADRCTHAGLFPVAYTLGTDFRPASRRPVSEVVRWNEWS
jgi:nitroreductase